MLLTGCRVIQLKKHPAVTLPRGTEEEKIVNPIGNWIKVDPLPLGIFSPLSTAVTITIAFVYGIVDGSDQVKGHPVGHKCCRSELVFVVDFH